MVDLDLEKNIDFRSNPRFENPKTEETQLPNQPNGLTDSSGLASLTGSHRISSDEPPNGEKVVKHTDDPGDNTNEETRTRDVFRTLVDVLDDNEAHGACEFRRFLWLHRLNVIMWENNLRGWERLYRKTPTLLLKWKHRDALDRRLEAYGTQLIPLSPDVSYFRSALYHDMITFTKCRSKTSPLLKMDNI
jgi:hypothetical protein